MIRHFLTDPVRFGKQILPDLDTKFKISKIWKIFMKTIIVFLNCKHDYNKIVSRTKLYKKYKVVYNTINKMW